MRADIDRPLAALGEQLGASGHHVELVVIGGAALQILGLINRATQDVDVVAIREAPRLRSPDPLPLEVVEAAGQVARDYGLRSDWLNTGPSDLLRLGLPNGFEDRTTAIAYSDQLVVHFAGRADQIFLKLYAMVDQGAGRHEADLRDLKPTTDELVAAGRWTRTHDPSEGFRSELIAALEYLGVEDADSAV